MSAFIRRFTSEPSLETLLEIEAVNIIDLVPPEPQTGVGTGNLLCVGEFEDGPFAAGGDSPYYNPSLRGAREVLGSADLLATYGGFGFVRGTVPYQDPVARRRAGELWNGNGYLKLRFLRVQRLMIARVDNGVGEVAFSALAGIDTAPEPFALAVAQQLTMEVNGGAPDTTTAIAAAAAQVTGAAGTYPTTFAGGESMSLALDGANPVTIVFQATDQLLTDVVSRINSTMGATIASVSGGQLRLTGLVEGTDGEIVVANVSGTPLTTFGIAPGTTAGTGNVGNLAQVTAAELAAIAAGSGITGLTVRVTSDGRVRFRGATSIEIASGAMATALGISPVDTLVTAGEVGGLIPAGTRVTDGADTWLTLQTLTCPAGDAGPYAVKVRRATDDGTGSGASGGTVTTVTDQPPAFDVSVNNPSALSAPLSESAMDVAYENAFDVTLALDQPTAQADYTLSARRTTPVVVKGRQNAIDASSMGCFGRKFLTRSALGRTPSQIIADVAAFRSDRVFYAGPGWRVRIPEIALLGTAGGLGFTEDGVITVGSDGPLATLCCSLNPEENPGQNTNGLIDEFFEVENVGIPLTIEVYKAFKAAGVAAPKVDLDEGPCYQSGVTSSLDAGRTTMARRRFADFFQDSIARIAKPYSKRLNRRTERDALFGEIESFAQGLLSPQQPSASRIESYRLDDGSNFNPPTNLARGIYRIASAVRIYSSLDAIVLQTEIGTNAITTTDA